VLESAGVTLGDEDVVKCEETDDGYTVTIERSLSQIISTEVKLAVDEITENVVNYTNEMIFGDSNQIVLNSNPQTSDIIGAEKLEIGYSYDTVTQTIKHGYKTVYSKNLDKGKTSVTEGKNGEKKIVYKVKTINGIVVERVKESEEITVKAQNQIKTIGTRVQLSSENAVQTSDDVPCISVLKPNKPIELDKNGIPTKYDDCLTGIASAYCGKCDSDCTATGLAAIPGRVAVNPKQIPYGTKLYIVSADGKYVYGYAVAADTGGFAYNGSGRIVDRRMPTGSSCNCNSFGLKKVNIYILPD
jgi:3D (Asp-Asp-Asp) domain-containing protein